MWDRQLVLSGVLVVVLWVVSQALVTGPGVPVEARCPAVYRHPEVVGP